MSEANPVGRPLLFKSAEELQAKIDLYFETEAKVIVTYVDGEPIYEDRPTMSGLALFIGVDRKTITNYSQKDEFFHTIKSARARVEVALEKHLYGKNVTGAIFNLKNNFDWCDKNEIAHTSPDGSMSPKELVDSTLVKALVDKLTD